ncbi:ankyrin repeat domain-containing protein [Ethanoligenens sp.]|uniref:ankyrin repeat domain-containing protein n=1 Tax=Ethanoligenens sp. TaxID=2099655 RepID=UPI0039E8A0E2
MDLSHALLDAVQTNDGEKVSRMLIGHKEDANKLIAGATPLHYAVEHGADKSVAALLKKGAYVDAINENRKTPLFRAVERGDAKMTRQLLKAGADPELSDGKRFIQDISASKAIKSMLDEYTVNKQNGLGRGMSPRSSRRR